MRVPLRAFGRTDLLPEKLRAALPLIEAAAFSENATLLDSVIQRRIPCISLNRSCPLDCALELWFACPEELPQFVKARSDTPTLRPTDSAPASPFTPERSEVPIPNRGSSSSVTPPKSDEGDLTPVNGVEHPDHDSQREHTAPNRTAVERQSNGSPSPGAADDVSVKMEPPLGRGEGELPVPIHNLPLTGHTKDSELGFRPLNTENCTLNTSSAPPLTSTGAHCTLNTSSNLKTLLDDLARVFGRFVVPPKYAAETLALFVPHTYAFALRDVTTYIGVQSPVRRCGKSTLLTLLSRLVNRPVVAANVSSSSLFHAVEELQPTLIIDEADTFFKVRGELQGILNAGYHKPMAYVLRVSNEPRTTPRHISPASKEGSALNTENCTLNTSNVPDPHSFNPINPFNSVNSSLRHFSTWCPKVIAQIGHLPHTLADRCIVFTMQRKSPGQKCERLRQLTFKDLQQQCAGLKCSRIGRGYKELKEAR